MNYSLPRFHKGPVIRFLKRMSEAAVTSRRMTEGEKRVSRLKWSVENDFKDGFAGRAHGDEAYTVAMRQIESLGVIAERERKEVEIQQLREEIMAVEELLREKQARLTELDNSRGSAIHHQNQAAWEMARQRLAARSAAAG